METILFYLPYFQRLGVLIAIIFALLLFIFWKVESKRKQKIIVSIVIIFGICMYQLPLWIFGSLPHVASIIADPEVKSHKLLEKKENRVRLDLELHEVISEIDSGVTTTFWTYNGTVPGPFLKVTEGDTIDVSLKNPSQNRVPHNIDFHAVNGPGGGGVVTNVMPGETKKFSFKALNSGLFVYHCAFPSAAAHMSHGMYGLILVEPKGGLPKVDREFYVMQGEMYTNGPKNDHSGFQYYDLSKMANSKPNYIIFNGRVGALDGKMKAKVGEKIRIYVGNGGVNLISSFHIIGEVFDSVYPEGNIGGAIFKNVQTTLVPAGGSAIVEFTTEVPGKYLLVDHALARVQKGAIGTLVIEGNENKTIFDGIVGEMTSH